MYYRLDITCTSKTMGCKPEQVAEDYSGYSTFDNISKSFETIGKIKEWLKSQYGTCKRVPMYRGETEKVGYIYCFKNKDWSHDSKWWWQQDWVEVKEVREKTVLI